jgi:hypothetical protein
VNRELADIPERPKDYPDPTMFGLLPAHGLYIRHAAGISMRGVQFRGLAEETRPAILMDDVQEATIHDALGQLRVRVSGTKSRNLKFAPGVQVAADSGVPADAIRP